MARLGSNVLLPASIQFIINVVMTIPAILFIDPWGRRPTMLVGAFLMALWLFINAGLLATYSTKPTPEQGFTSASESMSTVGAPAKAAIACTYLTLSSPCPWQGVSLSTSANWAFNFALAYFVPPAFANIQWKVYIVFSVFCVSMFIHVFFLFPETTQKTLQEVEGIFDDSTPSSFEYLGTPAWKIHVDTHARRLERGEMDAEEKFGRQVSRMKALLGWLKRRR